MEERDGVLKELMDILERAGVSVNDLEYELRSNKKMWVRLN